MIFFNYPYYRVFVSSVLMHVMMLQAIDLPLTKQQLDTLLNMLDKDGDGEVDYG